MTNDQNQTTNPRQWVESVTHPGEPEWSVNFLGQHRLHTEERIVGAVGALQNGKYEGWLWTTPQSTLVCVKNTMESARSAVLKRYLESEAAP